MNAASPGAGIEGILRDAAWRSERIINWFRVAYTLAMGAPAVIWSSGAVASREALIAFGAWFAVAVAAAILLRRNYHPVYSWVLSTTDIAMQEVGLYLQSQLLEGVSHEHSLSALYGIGTSGAVIATICVVRFSWPLALWSVSFAYGLYVALAVHAIGWNPGFGFEGVLFAFLFGLLFLGTRRFRELPLRVKERDAFARFLPAPAVERITRDPSAINLGGEEQEVTVLFSDLRGFTTLASGLEAPAVVRLLNEYFREMVDELFSHGGTLDKFIGDGLCAVFGPPFSPDEQARRAIACALGMQQRLEKLNAGWRARGEPVLELGIGIHCGKVVAGNIGSPMRLEYTHIGDAVNTCSRIEGLTKELGSSLLASRAVIDRAGVQEGWTVRDFPAMPLRGRSEPIVLCAIQPRSAAASALQAVS